MWQTIVVGLIVVAAVLYTAWALVPALLRQRLAGRLGAWGRSSGRPAWLVRATTSVENAATARAGGCHDCIRPTTPGAPGAPGAEQQRSQD